MKGLAPLFAVPVMATLATGWVAAQPEDTLDFFGTVVSRDVDTRILVVNTENGNEVVETDGDTKFRLRNRGGRRLRSFASTRRVRHGDSSGAARSSGVGL